MLTFPATFQKVIRCHISIPNNKILFLRKILFSPEILYLSGGYSLLIEDRSKYHETSSRTKTMEV